MSVQTVHDFSTPGCEQLVHCFTHERDEPETPFYRVCGDCGHVFITVEELVIAEMEVTSVRREIQVGVENPRMRLCPYCTHPF